MDASQNWASFTIPTIWHSMLNCETQQLSVKVHLHLVLNHYTISNDNTQYTVCSFLILEYQLVTVVLVVVYTFINCCYSLTKCKHPLYISPRTSLSHTPFEVLKSICSSHISYYTRFSIVWSKLVAICDWIWENRPNYQTRSISYY